MDVSWVTYKRGIPTISDFATTSGRGSSIVVNTITSTPYYLGPGDIVTPMLGQNPVYVEWFGIQPAAFAGDSSAAATNSAAWEKMIEVLTVRAYAPFVNYIQLGQIVFNNAEYHFSDTVEIAYGTVKIVGAGPGLQTRLVFPVNTTGIRIESYQSFGPNPAPVADHIHSISSSLVDLEIVGPYAGNVAVTNEGEYHGIDFRTTVYCQNVTANGFQGDAWHVVVGATSMINRGNANLFQLINCSGRFCRHGIQLGGADANAYTIMGGSFDNNRAWGHYEPDNASLGGVVIGTHYDSNGITTVAPFGMVTYTGNQYCVIDGQEAWASANAPSGGATDNTGWAWVQAGAVTSDRPTWFAGIGVRSSGPVLSKSVNSITTFFICYSEPGYGLPQLDWGNWIIGGGLGGSRIIGNAASLVNSVGNLIFRRAPTFAAGLLSNDVVRITGSDKAFYINTTNAYSSLVFEQNGSTTGVIEQFAGTTYHTTVGANPHVFRYSGGTESGRFATTGVDVPTGKVFSVNGTQVITSRQTKPAVPTLTDVVALLTTHGLWACLSRIFSGNRRKARRQH
jgi:hypothetical protein